MTGSVINHSRILADRYIGPWWIWARIHICMRMSANNHTNIWSSLFRNDQIHIDAAMR